MVKKKKYNRLLYIVLGVVVLVIILAVVKGSTGGSGTTEVKVSKAKKATIVEKVSGSGTVQPVIEVKISPEVSGEIIELNIEEGDSVNRRDFLLKLRPDNFISARDRAMANYNERRANLKSSESNLSRTKASFIRAEQDWKRQQKLYAKKVISVADFETAKANFEIANQDEKAAEQSVDAAQYILKSAKATVKEANENLRLTNITSPMNGIVSKLSVEKGETVVGTSQMQGTEMLRIADLSKMEVRVDINENDIIRVDLGDRVEIDVDSYSHLEKTFVGEVTQIANSANDKTSVDAVTEFEVRILILSESYKNLITQGNKYPFRPGMTASVNIITESKEDILTVPLVAVTTRNLQSGKDDEYAKDKEGKKNKDKASREDQDEVVFVLKQGVVVLAKVKTGISDFENIEILNGLEEGAEIVSGPFIAVSKRLNDGDKVKLEEDKEKNKNKDEN